MAAKPLVAVRPAAVEQLVAGHLAVAGQPVVVVASAALPVVVVVALVVLDPALLRFVAQGVFVDFLIVCFVMQQRVLDSSDLVLQLLQPLILGLVQVF